MKYYITNARDKNVVYRTINDNSVVEVWFEGTWISHARAYNIVDNKLTYNGQGLKRWSLTEIDEIEAKLFML